MTVLLDVMYCFGHVPTALKQGMIITLYKGGGKPRNDSGSYRAITLSYSILKLYENVFLKRLKNL